MNILFFSLNLNYCEWLIVHFIFLVRMLLLIVTFFESYFYKNYIALSIAYIISILFLVILLIMTDRTNKQVLQLIQKKKNPFCFS